ncbi:MAG: rhodanese-like domain-containing protein [Gemmataceae bacterium]
MILKQYYLGCLAHASYLIADDKTGLAAVVDPQRDIDQYLKDAEDEGYEIKYVFLTHFHADFLAGHIELRDRTGAQICLGSRAQPDYDFRQLRDGDIVEFGDVRLQILETPGHTPEGISILVYDLKVSDSNPHAVFTGDTLFIGDVGRPDLLASIGVTADELADMLYDSITNILLNLPDETLIYPAHGAGSMCGKSLSNERVSTIGEQKKFNYALQPMSKEDFVRLVKADQPEAPAYFVHDAILNRQERPNLEKSMEKSLTPLSLDDVLQLQTSGVQILDVRDAADYEGAHLAGVLNISLKGKYATWAGTLLENDKEIVVIAEPGEEEEAIMRLGRIGFDNVTGYLDGGMHALDERPDLVRMVKRITAQALANRLHSQESLPVVDVRSEKEWQAGHIVGSSNIPLNHLRQRSQEISVEKSFVVHCQSGYRSAIAVSVLEQKGFSNMLDLVGGFQAWEASKLPTTSLATEIS